jgi:hypothetical protein
MPSITGASTLYILRGTVILVPDSSGIPEIVDPQPLILRIAYISPDFFDTQLARAQVELASEHCTLFVPLQSSEGPPYRSGLIFAFRDNLSGISWRDEKTERHGAQMTQFGVTTPLVDYTWSQDVRRGRSGYFVTGQSPDTSLWRVFRLEADALGRQVFTIAPVQFSPNCPRADFSSVADAGLRAEVIAQYDEFCQRVTASAYRDVLTKARNIVEGLVAYKLNQQGRSLRRDLGTDLQTVRDLLNGPTRETCGWSDLEYHLAHKIRLLHAQTHPTVVTDAGRPIRPEFALTVAEDLAELLRVWRYVTSS